MKTVTMADVTQHDEKQFCTDASTLGLAPGEWPSQLPTDLGNGNPFLIAYHNADVVHYLQKMGTLRLAVFND